MLRIRKSLTIHQAANWGDSRLRTESIYLRNVLCPSKATESAGNPDHTAHGDAYTKERESTTNRIHLSCEGVLGDPFFKREDWRRNHIP